MLRPVSVRRHAGAVEENFLCDARLLMSARTQLLPFVWGVPHANTRVDFAAAYDDVLRPSRSNVTCLMRSSRPMSAKVRMSPPPESGDTRWTSEPPPIP